MTGPTNEMAAPTMSKRTPQRAVQTRGRGARHVSGLIAKLTAPLVRGHGLPDSGILQHWPEIVGSGIAGACMPEKLVFAPGERREGTLHVRVAGAYAPVLQHVEPQIVERINAYCGYRAVARLRLIQGPLPGRPAPAARSIPAALRPEEEQNLQSAVADVGDDRLRGALARLGRAVFTTISKD